MAITDNVRKALTDTTPFYAAAGTLDLAAEKLREVQPLLEKLRDEAPNRFEKVRATDPKVVQDRVARQAKDVQARLTEAMGGVELDLRKLRDNAQEFAMQQVGRAAEYAVRAGETYNGLVDRGRGAVRTWRGEAAECVQDIAVTVEPEPSPTRAAAQPAPQQTTPQQTPRNGAAKPGQGRKAPQSK